MYLTQMPLNPQRRSTRDLVASPQRVHAAVLAGFLPGVSERGRVLWRLDVDGAHSLNLFVVSTEVPSFDALAEQAGWSSNPVWRTAEYDRFLDRLEHGQRWVFRLVANPVRAVRDPRNGVRRGQRVPLIKETDQRNWLMERAEKSGFSLIPGTSGVENLMVTNSQRSTFERRTDGTARTVTVQRVQYDGVLEVADPQTLRGTLVSGIGSAKGYGCGLLTLAPAK